MASSNDTASMALFCDFENIALGVRDAQYEKFDIRPVLERLLAKGSIVVKKAYCDWDRYKGFKAAMHEANFELIEIPHVRQSGKNSADIRMVVDALDLCYTKSHVDTFVIISGDSDFSPLVSKLRENAKKVIGVGVKQSCSDLLVTNCDEFIYYDDLVRDREAGRAQRKEREKRSPEEEAKRREKQEERKAKAIEIVHATFVDLMADRGDSDRIWASVLKEVVKRRNPGFNENYYGFRTFGNLLEDAAGRGLLGFGRDDKGAFVFRAPAKPVMAEGQSDAAETPVVVAAEIDTPTVDPVQGSETTVVDASAGKSEGAASAEKSGRRRGGRRNPRGKESREPDVSGEEASAVFEPPQSVVEPLVSEPALENATPSAPEKTGEPAMPGEKPKRAPRRPRKPAAKADTGNDAGASPAASASAPVEAVAPPAEQPAASEEKPRKARSPRNSRPRKPKAKDDAGAA